jgi:hypothetical protein
MADFEKLERADTDKIIPLLLLRLLEVKMFELQTLIFRHRVISKNPRTYRKRQGF